jgi:hypothetical protein
LVRLVEVRNDDGDRGFRGLHRLLSPGTIQKAGIQSPLINFNRKIITAVDKIII